MPYWSLADLQALIGTQVVNETYDDARLGAPDPILLSQVQALSDSMVDGVVGRIYPGPFPIVQNFPVWAAAQNYQTGAEVVPIGGNGYAFRLVGPGGTSGGTQPAWPTQLSSSVTDNGLLWVCISLTPELIRYASLLWGKALSYERHAEYNRIYGDKPRKEAEKFLNGLIEAKAYLEDALNFSIPSNSGGLLYAHGARMTVDTRSGHSTTGDF
jgi:hypothetical protein